MDQYMIQCALGWICVDLGLEMYLCFQELNTPQLRKHVQPDKSKLTIKNFLLIWQQLWHL